MIVPPLTGNDMTRGAKPRSCQKFDDLTFDGAILAGLNGYLKLRLLPELLPMELFIFGPDDYSIGQPLDEPGAIEKLAGFLFNPKPRCCTFQTHRSNKYFIPSGVRSRSVGFRCSSCEATVRKCFFRSKRVYTCRCSVFVLGDKATPFTEAEWHAYRISTLGRSVVISSFMEGGQDGGKN